MSFYTYVPDAEAPTTLAIRWRNDELARTDILVATPDHPERENLLEYRTLLITTQEALVAFHPANF